MVLVPKAIAAIAAAPPTMKTSLSPSSWQAARTRSLRPKRLGGVQTTIRCTPATCAGTASITKVDG
jgi:hypothetical protein